MKLNLNHDMNGWFNTKFKLFHISCLCRSAECVLFGKSTLGLHTALNRAHSPLSLSIFFTVNTHHSQCKRSRGVEVKREKPNQQNFNHADTNAK